MTDPTNNTRRRNRGKTTNSGGISLGQAIATLKGASNGITALISSVSADALKTALLKRGDLVNLLATFGGKTLTKALEKTGGITPNYAIKVLENNGAYVERDATGKVTNVITRDGMSPLMIGNFRFANVGMHEVRVISTVGQKTQRMDVRKSFIAAIGNMDVTNGITFETINAGDQLTQSSTKIANTAKVEKLAEGYQISWHDRAGKHVVLTSTLSTFQIVGDISGAWHGNDLITFKQIDGKMTAIVWSNSFVSAVRTKEVQDMTDTHPQHLHLVPTANQTGPITSAPLAAQAQV